MVLDNVRISNEIIWLVTHQSFQRVTAAQLGYRTAHATARGSAAASPTWPLSPAQSVKMATSTSQPATLMDAKVSA